MCKVLGKGYCTVDFDKLFKKHIYGVGTAQRNRKGMSTSPSDKKMKRGDSDCQFSTNVGCCKWMIKRSVVMLFSNTEEMQAKSSGQYRVIKGSAAKVSVSCPGVIKFYNKSIGGMDLVDQRTAAYHLDRKSSIRFYLRIIFDLMDVACGNSYIVYNMLHFDDLTLLNFTIAVATNMIVPYTSGKRAAPENNIGSIRAYRYKQESTEVSNQLPEFQQNGHGCFYSYAMGHRQKNFSSIVVSVEFSYVLSKKETIFTNIISKWKSCIFIDFFIFT